MVRAGESGPRAGYWTQQTSLLRLEREDQLPQDCCRQKPLQLLLLPVARHWGSQTLGHIDSTI